MDQRKLTNAHLKPQKSDKWEILKDRRNKEKSKIQKTVTNDKYSFNYNDKNFKCEWSDK